MQASFGSAPGPAIITLCGPVPPRCRPSSGCPGARALSQFRLDKLLQQAREALPKLAGIRAQYWHFVKLARPLTQSEREVLESC